MIHRSLGPSLISVVTFAVSVGWAAHARACVTTTCAVKNPPPNCVRDARSVLDRGNAAALDGGCVSFSVDERGIPPLGLGYEDTEALVVSSFALAGGELRGRLSVDLGDEPGPPALHGRRVQPQDRTRTPSSFKPALVARSGGHRGHHGEFQSRYGPHRRRGHPK
jgi:hypothetical protein